MTAATGALGLTQNTSPYLNQQNTLANMYMQRAQDPNGIATQAYKGMANQGMGNVLANIAQTKGMNPSGAATMADIAGSRIQGQTAQNAGTMGLQEMHGNQNLASNLLMNMGNQNLQQQNQQQQNLLKSAQGLGAALA